MRSPILGSSDLPIIGEERCLRQSANKREGRKIVPMKHNKGLRFNFKENQTLT